MKIRLKFRKYPNWADYKIDSKQDPLINSLKQGGFKIGTAFSSVYFIMLLFVMQSFFLRQNLESTSDKFISN